MVVIESVMGVQSLKDTLGPFTENIGWPAPSLEGAEGPVGV